MEAPSPRCPAVPSAGRDSRRPCEPGSPRSADTPVRQPAVLAEGTGQQPHQHSCVTAFPEGGWHLPQGTGTHFLLLGSLRGAILPGAPGLAARGCWPRARHRRCSAPALLHRRDVGRSRARAVTGPGAVTGPAGPLRSPLLPAHGPPAPDRACTRMWLVISRVTLPTPKHKELKTFT